MVSFIWIILGVLLLYGGAEWLVRGGARLALRLGLAPLVVGLTVVSLCTSMPEAVASFQAQILRGLGDISLANIIGSNIANIGLILGITALVKPLPISDVMRKREAPLMLAILVIFTLLLIGGTLGRWAGLFLLLLLVAYFVFQGKMGKREVDVLQINGSARREVLLIAMGAVALALGGYFLIEGAEALGLQLGISERVIGLTVVAIGTSIPELATTVVAVVRGHPELAIGNVVGSNVLNCLFIGGGVAAISPIHFTSKLLTIDAPVMLFFGLLLCFLMWKGKRLVRWEGGLLLVLYIIFICTKFLN